MENDLLKKLINSGYLTTNATPQEQQTILRSLNYLLHKYREIDVITVVEEFIDKWYMYGQQEIRKEASFFINGIVKALKKYKSVEEINAQKALERANIRLTKAEKMIYKELIDDIITYAVIIHQENPIIDPKYKENVLDGVSDDDYRIAYTLMMQDKFYYSAIVAQRLKTYENYKEGNNE